MDESINPSGVLAHAGRRVPSTPALTPGNQGSVRNRRGKTIQVVAGEGLDTRYKKEIVVTAIKTQEKIIMMMMKGVIISS